MIRPERSNDKMGRISPKFKKKEEKTVTTL
jgi:hypothetical protein